MTGQFQNNSSQCLFIGNRNLEDVIFQDSKELDEIGGSFEAIAGRMQEIADFAKKKQFMLTHEEQSAWLAGLYEDFKARYGNDFHKNEKAWIEYGRRWANRMAQHPATFYDDKIAIVNILFTRGFQLCPFEGCNSNAWSEDVQLVSRKNGRQLTINSGTAHLARVHHLLEKDNEYGVSAREFYKEFM